MRLAKYLARSGVASRRAAEELIRSGRVSVGGSPVLDPAVDVDEDSAVAVDGRDVAPVASPVVWAVNKPAGVVSTARDTHGRPTVVELVRDRAHRRLYPVGRLDADTTGLLLLTDDGDLAHRLTHPRFGVPKTYRARLARAPVERAALERLRAGVELDDGTTAPARVRRLAPDLIELTLTEGRKRQVRRMCEAVGHPVRELRRVAFGSLKLGGLAEGRARRLTAAEVAALRAAAGGVGALSGSRRRGRSSRPG